MKFIYRRFFLKGLGILFLILISALLYFLYEIRISTPEIDEALYSKHILETTNDSTFRFGESFMRKNDYGIWEIYLTGNAAERGIAYGNLAEHLIKRQESYFVNQVERLVPNSIWRWLLKWFVAWFNRDLDLFIPHEYQEEIFAVAQFADDRFDYIAPKYYRKLNYHAAHDIGHAMKDLSMVGCTSFSVNDEYSEDGTILIGRNFDFYMGEDFSREKVFLAVKPDSGYGFVSYSWPGFVGVVSGMNEKGLTVTLNASRSDLPMKAKMPISILAREIVQYAANIQEAVAIAKKREVFVSESILIGSSFDGKSVVIEKSPENFAVFESSRNYLVCSNHYQSETYRDNINNIENIKDSDSKYRYDLMDQLLRNHFPVSVHDAVAILRNQKGQNGQELGMGNSKAINQLIAHHGVVFKPDQKQIWISASPFQCGKFLCYDLNNIFADTMTLLSNWQSEKFSIPKDTFLDSYGYSDYQYYRKIKEKLFDFYFLGIDFYLSPSVEDSFLKSNPHSYVTYLSLAEYYNKRKDYNKSMTMYQESLKNEPASLKEISDIQQKIVRCRKNL